MFIRLACFIFHCMVGRCWEHSQACLLARSFLSNFRSFTWPTIHTWTLRFEENHALAFDVCIELEFSGLFDTYGCLLIDRGVGQKFLQTCRKRSWLLRRPLRVLSRVKAGTGLMESFMADLQSLNMMMIDDWFMNMAHWFCQGFIQFSPSGESVVIRSPRTPPLSSRSAPSTPPELLRRSLESTF